MDKYSDLIAKIRRRRTWVFVFTLVAIVLIVLFASQIQIEVAGESIITYKGLLHPALAVFLVLLTLLVGSVLYALASLSLYSSMDQECDPEIHLILNMKLNRQKNIDHIYAVDYLYLGHLEKSVEHAEKMIASGKEDRILSGLFHKARCEFLGAHYDALSQTASEFTAVLSSSRKQRPKAIIAYQRIGDAMNLMLAIAKDDTDRINALRNSIEPWNTSKPTQGFVNYIKGIAAYKAGDRQEAVYRLKWVKENCQKTVFSALADGYLALI